METLEVFPFTIANDILIGEKVLIVKDVNIGELILNSLKSQPNFVAQVDATKGKEITFQEIRNRCVKLALWMRSSGIHQGDEIIISSNYYAVMYVFFAALFIGAIPILWHENHTFETAKGLVFEVKRKIMFIDDILAIRLFDNLFEERHSVIVVVFGIFTGFIQYNDLESRIDADYDKKVIDEFVCAQKNKKNIAAILYTRSTLRKSVYISHTTFMAAVNQQVFGMLPDGVGMWVGSFSSLTNMMLAVYLIISFKKTIRFMGYRKQEICQTLQKYKVNWVLLETYMCREIVNSNLLNKYDLSSLEMLIFTGSLISYDDHSNLVKSLPNTSIISLYGTTETGIISCQSKNGKLRSSGYIGKNVCLKFINRFGQSMGPNMSGAIYCISEAITNDVYHNYHEPPVETINENGWYYTGDIGYFDEDGDIFVLERLEDIILYKNFIFSPTIIENVISRYSAVESVAVVAVQDKIDYEHPVAYISTKPRKKLNVQKLMKEVEDKLEDHMKLRGGVKLILEMPYSISGNIDRILLREEANEDKYLSTIFM